MLKVLRNHSVKKNIFLFLVVALVASFGVSLVVVSGDESKTSSGLAKLDNRKISVQDYLNSYRAVQHQMQWMYGDREDMKNRVNLKGEAWDRLLLLDLAKKERIHISDKEVVDWITKQETFHNKGVFDQRYYEMFIERALRMDARTFEEEARQLLTIQKLHDKQLDTTPLSDDELKKLYQAERSEKEIVYAVLPWENLKSQLPEVTEKDIEHLYGLVSDKLTTSEEVKLSYINIPKEEVEAKKDLIQDGGTLDELMKKYAVVKKETPYFSKRDSIAELGFYEVLSEAFKLPVGQESTWIHHDGGATKLRVEDKKPERPMTMDEAKGELKSLFSRQKGMELAMKKMKDVKASVKDGNFEEALKAENLTAIPMRHKQGAPNPINPPQALDRAVASLKDGDLSEPVDTANGALLVKVVSSAAMDEAAFEKEKEVFKQRAASQKADAKLNELLESQRKKLSLNLELMKELFPAE